jgi:ubiquinone/menaquinone biosynthesis C-methylase UbiE
MATDANAEATQAWDGPLFERFVEFRDILVTGLSNHGEKALALYPPPAGANVLDIGCGFGDTTERIAQLVGTDGHTHGVDVAPRFIESAKDEFGSDSVSFSVADVQFDDLGGPYEYVFSRFGVMFFDDPVRAFANLRRAATDDAHLLCLAWRSPSENPFMTTAERAAAPLLPNLPERRPGGPGQFAFADERRVRRILEESGWTGIDIRPIDVVCTLPEQELVRYLTELGPLGLVLHQADEPTRTRVTATVRAAFDPYVHGAEVRFTAACWMVAARASLVSAALVKAPRV